MFARVWARLELGADAALVPPGVARGPPVERRRAHLRRGWVGGEALIREHEGRTRVGKMRC